MESAEITLLVLDWLDRNGSRETDAARPLWDPHTPYRAPEWFGKLFAGEPLPDLWITEEIFERHLAFMSPARRARDKHGTTGPTPYPRHPQAQN